MKKFVSTFVLLLLLCSVPVSLQKINIVQAEAKTIVVPDDYVTIQEAINSANEGDTLFIKRGIYEENTLTINKTLSIIGENANHTKITLRPLLLFMGWLSVVPLFAYEPPIKIEANDVKLTGVTVTSEETNQPVNLEKYKLGKTDPEFGVYEKPTISATANRTQILSNIILTGLRVNRGYDLTIAENTLTGLNLYGFYCNITGNNFATGSSLNIGGSDNNVCDNTITDVAHYSGITLFGNRNVIANNTVTKCYYGVMNRRGSDNLVFANRFLNNIYGLLITGGDDNTFFRNDLVNNTCGAEIGYYLEPPPTNCTLHHNNFVDNIMQVSTRANRAYIPGVSKYPFYLTGFFDDGREGNFWSDYDGKDRDGDGIGDEPYVIDENRKDNYPLMTPLDISKVSVFVVCPENKTYATASVSLNFTVYKPTSWISCSLDGQANVTITGNTTLSGLSEGSHSLTVYARDVAGNTGASETVYFSIEVPPPEPQPLEPFPTWIVAVTVIIAVVGAAFLIYFRKIKKKRELSDLHP